MTRRQLPLLLLTVAVAVVFGITLCTAWHNVEAETPADDPCRELVHRVVTTVWTEWAADSEAVMRTQETVRVPVVVECLDGAQ